MLVITILFSPARPLLMDHYQTIADQVTFYPGIYIAAMIIGETILSWWLFRKTYKKELAVNLVTAGVSIFTVGLFKAYVFSALFIQVYNHRLFDIRIHWYPVMLSFHKAHRINKKEKDTGSSPA
ncbi:MAG: hypothetical protein IPP02_08600 [Chitinophagaceae bacterium]|nr:hypothetical protein [Chitinophagaceae bacterium]MBK7677899.1 hypothetical protein [Chitinophagaceae bacterium]MBK9464418.1 hypothetical protein [Chitinophagaceae bacterium]MBK9658455.1 hypothetical protein [Chitinophagaceae bacterium]MBK9938431.1 hypothetical protein [Chitinophagaceae bacterium]